MTTVDRLVEEASVLTPDELDELLCRLGERLGDERAPLSGGWQAEINRREDDVRLGRATFIDWDDARVRLRGGQPQP